MATVGVAARVKNGWALGGSLLVRRQASKRLWEDLQRGCGEARQGYRLPKKKPRRLCPRTSRWAFSWADVVGYRKISKGRTG